MPPRRLAHAERGLRRAPSSDRRKALGFVFFHGRLAGESRYPTQDAVKALERGAERDSAASNSKFANRVLMCASSLLNNRDCPSNPACGFKEAEKDHRVRKVGNVNGRFQIADNAVLGDRYESRDAPAIEKLK